MNFREENGKKSTRVLIDISPLIDVVFILLLFFAVSTTFKEEVGLPLTLPTSKVKATKVKQKNVTIYITKDGTYYIGKKKLEDSMLVDEIKKQLEISEKKEVVIKADKGAKYEKVYKAMDASRQAGAKGLMVAGSAK
ncbi:biopolymer transport protein ExbD [Thermotomaculum hydrothermale]|uniref:Biopolymer transport protein ExbD n=1 Tax=Thermotomaculum hydrothermale TaxID=981385 RepID=A0A7R6PW82_9BACT|nr:biopolymer transporter ExbD [Thermotomaculum hydrothermale]BBB31745.1 biopolymer transport protein ExbD [Thermotomaculum hydrothermale]